MRTTPFLFGFGSLGTGLVAKSKFKFLDARGGFLRGGRCASFWLSSSIIIRSLSSTSLCKGVDSGCNLGVGKGDIVRVVAGSDGFKFMTLKAGKVFMQHSYLGSNL